jgi:hypothetical protein
MVTDTPRQPDPPVPANISPYVRSKMQCAAPVSSLAIRSTDWLPIQSAIGRSIPSVASI